MAKLNTSRDMHGAPIQKKRVDVMVTEHDIQEAECRKAQKCMIKVAVKRALNMAHGYIHVDARGVSISRNGEYREKAELPQKALEAMLAFDNKWTVKPFKFRLDFKKTRPVGKVTDKQRREYTARARKTGNAKKKYTMRARVVGISISGGGEVLPSSYQNESA